MLYDFQENKMGQKKEISVKEKNGVYIVPAKLIEGDVMAPDPEGEKYMVFWDKECLNFFLRNYDYIAVINTT